MDPPINGISHVSFLSLLLARLNKPTATATDQISATVTLNYLLDRLNVSEIPLDSAFNSSKLTK